MHAAILFVHGIINTVGIKITGYLNAFSSAWHMVGVVVLVITLLAVAPTHQSAKTVFTDFYGQPNPHTPATGLSNNG